jgi:hypothetical protein
VSLRVVGGDEGEVSSLRRWNVVAGPVDSDPGRTALARTGSGCGRRTRLSSGGGEGAPHLSDNGGSLVVGLRWTGQLTVGRNMRLDSTSSCLRGNEYKGKKWSNCWRRCFVFGPPRIYLSMHNRLALQGMEANSNHLHRSPASRKRRRKGNPVPGV